MYNLKKQQGNALAITLILLLITSLIVFTQLENQVLHQKIQHYFLSKQITFYNAEIGLKLAENEIENKKTAEPNTTAQLTHHVQLLSTDQCGNKLYDLTAKAILGGTKTILEEKYLKQHLPVIEDCQSVDQVFGRIFWCELG